MRYLGPDGPQATDAARRDPASEANVTWSKPTVLRSGWMPDGTGCGKGRQVTGIILDCWLQNALPQARIVYSSATGASTIDGLCGRRSAPR